MATKKHTYKRKSRRLAGIRASWVHRGTLYRNIHGKRTNIGKDYTQFFSKLDDKATFKYYAYKLAPYSKSWNSFRRKHLTASETKRILQWRQNSAYIFRHLTKYISAQNPNRGMILEKYLLKVLKLNDYQIEYTNSLWVHKYIPWMSCSTDGIITNNDKFVAAVEIKTFSSLKSMERTIIDSPSGPVINKESRIYYQIQSIAEVVDVPYVVLVYEFEFKVNKLVIKKDMDFIWSRFEKLRRFYFVHYIPFLLYGLPQQMKHKGKNYKSTIDEETYEKLLELSKRTEHTYRNNSEDSIFEYGINELPSLHEEEYFDMFTDHDVVDRLINENLKYADLSVFADELKNEGIQL